MPNWVQSCPNCPGPYHAIGGDGPQPAPVLCIAERPGRDENRNGRILCGKTGQEFDELYLPLAGLERRDVRCCNTLLCWSDNNKTPTDKEIWSCAPHHIPQEIEMTRPEVIVLMGSTACKLVPGIRLDLHHGIPQHTDKVGTLFGWSGWLIPMYHPSIGLHESRWMTILMEDWAGLKALTGNGAGLLVNDPPPSPTDYCLADESGVNGYFLSVLEYGLTPAMDTESHGPEPWSMQISAKPGTGILVRANDKAAVSALDFWMRGSEVIMHHAAHDLEEARRMCVRITRYRDTMQEAYQLGNLPQGLKALAYRLFRHTMTSYEETVRPASIHALQDWMLEAVQIAEADLTYITPRYGKAGKRLKDEVKKGELESLLRRLLSNTDSTSDYDPWIRLDAFYREETNEWMVSHVESRIGPYPILGIGNCKLEDAVRYAVGDADLTGQVAVELERRRHGAFEIYDGDQDN